MLASILGAPQENEYFGAEPGDVPYDMQVDPSKLTAQPYKPDNIWGKMQGSPADRANTASVLGQQRADQMFERQVQMARERAIVEAEQEALKRQNAILDAQVGGLDETKAASVARGTFTGKRQGTLSQIMPAFTSEQEAALALANYGEGLLNHGVAGNAVEQEKKRIDNSVAAFNYGQLPTDTGLRQDKQRLENEEARFKLGQLPTNMDIEQRQNEAAIVAALLANRKAEADRWLEGSTLAGPTRVWENGRILGNRPGMKGQDAEGFPGTQYYRPATGPTPDTPFYGAMPPNAEVPGVGYFDFSAAGQGSPTTFKGTPYRMESGATGDISAPPEETKQPEPASIMSEFGPPSPAAAFQSLRQDLYRNARGGSPTEAALTLPLYEGLAEILGVGPQQVGSSSFYRAPRSVIANERDKYAEQFEQLPDEQQTSLYLRGLNSFQKNPYMSAPLFDWSYGPPKKKNK